MKKIIYSGITVLVLLLAACTLHFPYDWGVEYRDYRVILLIEPDDADVLLDGKFIGEAYEFSKEGSALRLHSRNHELIIKKKGYTEEVVDLGEYASNTITVRLKLLKDRRYYSSPEKPGEVEGKREMEKTGKTEYVPKTEPVKEPPVQLEKEEDVKVVDAVNVSLEISPKESSIYLDGRFWGITPESGKIDNLRLKPGRYTLEVVKPGYKDYKKLLDVKDKDIKLILKLQEQ